MVPSTVMSSSARSKEIRKRELCKEIGTGGAVTELLHTLVFVEDFLKFAIGGRGG